MKSSTLTAVIASSSWRGVFTLGQSARAKTPRYTYHPGWAADFYRHFTESEVSKPLVGGDLEVDGFRQGRSGTM